MGISEGFLNGNNWKTRGLHLIHANEAVNTQRMEYLQGGLGRKYQRLPITLFYLRKKGKWS